jgi:hypothetical protein
MSELPKDNIIKSRPLNKKHSQIHALSIIFE